MVNVAILGFGVVGSGVAEVLTGNGAGISKKADELISLKYVLDVRDFPDSPFAACFVKDFSVIEQDPEVNVVVETIGGVGAALDFTERALKAGKSVVTSNKELVATHGRRLLELAAEHQAVYLFEASVGGGIPILRPLSECMAANDILEICGILNGTANYIFTRMVQDGIPFAQALKGAQANGYAEQNPAADVEGQDTCRKLCILSSIAFGWHLLPEQVPTTGITSITLADEAYADACQRRIKLLGRAIAREDGTVCAYVEPTLVGAGDLEAAVPANFNLITYEAEQLGRQSFYGQGAGRFPTAENVVQDCLTVLSGKRGFYTDRAVPMFLTSGEAHPYYVRTSAPDAFLRGRTAETWDNGAVITGAVDVYEMLAWAKAQREKDPGVFIAGIR